MKPNSDDSWVKNYALYGTAGIQLVILILGGVFLGSWLDKRWQTGPWLTLLGLCSGSTVGIYQLIRMVTKKE